MERYLIYFSTCSYTDPNYIDLFVLSFRGQCCTMAPGVRTSVAGTAARSQSEGSENRDPQILNDCFQ